MAGQNGKGRGDVVVIHKEAHDTAEVEQVIVTEVVDFEQGPNPGHRQRRLGDFCLVARPEAADLTHWLGRRLIASNPGEVRSGDLVPF